MTEAAIIRKQNERLKMVLKEGERLQEELKKVEQKAKKAEQEVKKAKMQCSNIT